MITVQDIVTLLEGLAPPALAESWDKDVYKRQGSCSVRTQVRPSGILQRMLRQNARAGLISERKMSG